jgi:biotin operon repressor
MRHVCAPTEGQTIELDLEMSEAAVERYIADLRACR